MSFNFSNFLKSDIAFILMCLLMLACVIGLSVFLWKRALSNGATVAQVAVGKKIGELCTSNAMCGTNKCYKNVCII